MEAACQILEESKRIAVPGMSPKPHRTSHAIAMAMRELGYEIIPVNPGHEQIEGMACYPRLEAIPEPVDIVNVFRGARYQHEVCADVLAMPALPRCVWFQLNAGGEEVEDKLRRRGLQVFVNS